MRKSRLLPLTVLLLLALPGYGLCDVTDPCRTIAGILSVYPPMEVLRSEGMVRSARDVAGRPGCRVQACAPYALIAGEVDPAEALRRHFEGTGWEEDALSAADGPGTTAFAFRKSGISCRAEGGAHAGIEDGKPFRSERYELTVECAPTE